MRRRILFDLRSIDYGYVGGIENVAYYAIDSLKGKDVDIILDVRSSARKMISKRYQEDSNIRIISDPVEGIFHRLNRYHMTRVLRLIDNTLHRLFGWELFRRRTKWANSIDADVVIYPSHLDLLQHEKVPAISFMHALLPGYTEKEMIPVESHVRGAKALISLWRYPYREFITRYPERAASWHQIPCLLTINLESEEPLDIPDMPTKFWLYVTFFTERKNHLNLVKGYKSALEIAADLPALLFVGRGNQNYYEKVVQLIDELELTKRIKVIFDFLPHSQIAQLYKAADGIVAPTLWEAASGTVAEACLAGKPVACSDVPPLRDFADCFDLNMLFFDPTIEEDIAQKLVTFYRDSEKYKSWGRDNSEKLRKYDKNYFGNELIGVIDSVCCTSRPLDKDCSFEGS